jgi:hypothetical protein
LFFFFAAIAELLDNAVDEVCSIHLNLSCISLKISCIFSVCFWYMLQIAVIVF